MQITVQVIAASRFDIFICNSYWAIPRSSF